MTNLHRSPPMIQSKTDLGIVNESQLPRFGISHRARRDRHRALRRRGPDELAAVQPLGVQRQADAIMPKNLGQIAPTPAEDIEIAGMGIALKAPLDRQSQALHAGAHVRVPRRDPYPDAARDRDHRRLRSSSTRCSASASTSRSTRTRKPPLSSISIIPPLARRAGGDDGGCGAHVGAGADGKAISTGTSAGTASPLSRPSRANRRHVNNWLADTPLCRAVTETNRGPP